LGNIYSALVCEQWALQHQAKLLLRIEDIDFTRCKSEYSKQMIDDLAWLGIQFDDETIYQQQHLESYQQNLHKLIDMGVVYPCFCTRKQVKHALHQQHIAHSKFDDYPKICSALSLSISKHRMQTENYAWRLNMRVVEENLGHHLYWMDITGEQHTFNISDIGDVIIGRKDIQYSYHLAVVVDDARQNMTHVIRGQDLKESTPIHTILQRLLGYKTPIYMHHPLITDVKGQKLAKTKHSIALKTMRDKGFSALQIREMLGF